MVIFLCGPDSYRKSKKLNSIFEKYCQKHITWRHFDFNNSEEESSGQFEKLKEFSNNYSMFENSKLAILNDFIFNFAKNNLKKAIEFLKSNLETKDFILIISEENNPGKDFEFLRRKPVLFQEFKNLEKNQYRLFIKKEAAIKQINLDIKSIYFLAEVFFGNTWALVNELNKLSLFNVKNFTIDDLKEIVVNPGSADNFSKFLNSVNLIINQPYLSKKLSNFESLLLNQEESAKIFNFIASRAVSAKNLQKLAAYDLFIKSGKIDYEEALTDLILSS